MRKTMGFDRLKWEALVYKDVRKTFADSVPCLFPEIPECTWEVKWQLFKIVAASSAARSYVTRHLIQGGKS